jgi:hypothetical protein
MYERFFVPAASDQYGLLDTRLQEVSESEQMEWLRTHGDEFYLAYDRVGDFEIGTYFSGVVYRGELIVYRTNMRKLGFGLVDYFTADDVAEARRNHRLLVLRADIIMASRRGM